MMFASSSGSEAARGAIFEQATAADAVGGTDQVCIAELDRP